MKKMLAVVLFALLCTPWGAAQTQDTPPPAEDQPEVEGIWIPVSQDSTPEPTEAAVDGDDTAVELGGVRLENAGSTRLGGVKLRLAEPANDNVVISTDDVTLIDPVLRLEPSAEPSTLGSFSSSVTINGVTQGHGVLKESGSNRISIGAIVIDGECVNCE